MHLQKKGNLCSDGRKKTLCLEIKDGKLSLKNDLPYYHQIQGQLMVTGSTFCELTVWSSSEIHIQRIAPDYAKMATMLHVLSDFYKNRALLYLKFEKKAVMCQIESIRSD